MRPPDKTETQSFGPWVSKKERVTTAAAAVPLNQLEMKQKPAVEIHEAKDFLSCLWLKWVIVTAGKINEHYILIALPLHSKRHNPLSNEPRTFKEEELLPNY